MNPVEFVSAGAGSGKTYRLTQIVSDALAAGSARPQGILATTFTIKAAAELRERARAKLLESGRVDLASAIGQSRIGTVNSVCGQLLSRFCFEVGMSPDQVVLDRPQAEQLLKATLASRLTPEACEEFVALSRRFAFKDDEWAKPVASIAEAARENAISPDSLRPMGPANAEAMLASWPEPQSGVEHAAVLAVALGTAADGVQQLINARVATEQTIHKYLNSDLDKLRNLKKDFESGDWSWQTWASTASFAGGGKLTAPFLPLVAEAARMHEVHPQFRSDVRRYLTLAFELAADTLDSYAQAKLHQGTVDFVDQGVLLLNALRNSEEVRQALSEELDLVVVDEFQDTNPLQLAIFVEIAKLAKRSVWVGDPKQAIYAFRGTDPTLIARIVASIEGWGGTIGEPLTTSRRSTPALVALSNAVFVKAFGPDMAAASVRLSSHREATSAEHASLHNWTFQSSYSTQDHLGIGVAVNELLAGGHQVVDKATGQLRAATAGDIAVLCRTHKEIALAVGSLSRCGIPSASGRPGLLATPEATFVLACLRRLQDPADTVATALIVSLSSGADHAQWLGDRLSFLAGEGKPYQWQTTGEGAHALIARLEELRPRLRALTPSEALRLAKAESHIAQLATRWSRDRQEAGMRIANVEALLAMATTYEDECVSARRPASVGGLLQWLRGAANAEQDARAVAAEGAVTVLTHYAAKGLEWPVVVLTGLEDAARSSLWNVRARTNGDFDAHQPLQNRFVHYWPYPYGRCNPPAAATAAQASQLGLAMDKAGREENLRLLYVSMTRARDTLVLASTTRAGALAWLDEVGATATLVGDSGPIELPCNTRLDRESRFWTKAECEATPSQGDAQALGWYQKGEALTHRPLWSQPSSAKGGRFHQAALKPVGQRIRINASVDMEHLGQALHLCIAKAGAHGLIDAQTVNGILERWGVNGAVATEDVLAQVEAFQAWVERRWPGCPVHVEIPLEVNLDEGTRLRGRIDFLVETPAGWVLLDHKSNPGGATRIDQLVNTHGPQLSAYADAIQRATKRPVIEKWLFLPVSAQAVRVEQVRHVEQTTAAVP